MGKGESSIEGKALNKKLSLRFNYEDRSQTQYDKANEEAIGSAK